jgi:hypothetical protein
MKSWSYIEPVDPANGDWTTRTITLTENEILERTYPWWAQQMMKAGKTVGITPLNCIEDFVVVHWASPVKGKP